jgi:protein SCO1/2
VLLPLAAACSRSPHLHWDLTSVSGALPDLRFNLATAGNRAVTAREFRGKVTLLFFGYTHCTDTCPLTMTRLAAEVKRLGAEARDVRIVFVSVDPRRDTPGSTDRFARAFSPEAVGLTGTPREIEAMAKRYRVAYLAQPPDRSGDYEVMHSKGVYVFDRAGRARLLIDDTDPPAAVVHDLRQLAGLPS